MYNSVYVCCFLTLESIFPIAWIINADAYATRFLATRESVGQNRKLFKVAIFSHLFCQITVLCKNFRADPQKNVALESQMDLEYFTRLRHGPVSSVIRWLQLRSLLANPLHCGACNRDMNLIERGDNHVDGFQWWVQFKPVHRPCSFPLKSAQRVW